MAKQKTTERSGFHILLLLFKYWKLLVFIGLISAVVAFVFSTPLFIKPIYKSSVIMFSTSSNAVSQLILAEGIYNEFIDVTQFGDDAHIEQMIQILNSREIKDHIIEKYNLVEHYNIDTNKNIGKQSFINTLKTMCSFHVPIILQLK